MTFDLIDQPWLPCVFPDGRTEERSLRRTFAEAHELVELQDPSPLVTVALHRLLLAVLHRAYKPVWKDWPNFWSAGRFEMKPLDDYFQEHREAFDLFHSERPFFQDASLRTKDPSPVTRLAKERATGNNATLFDHSTEEAGYKLTPAESARLLVAEQAFAVGGGKSERGYTTSGPMVGGVGVIAVGRTLFHTLLLNLVPPDDVKLHRKDSAAWEHAKPRWHPSHWDGVADLFTWQSRALRLRHEDGLVVAADYAQGRKLDPPAGSYEPMMPYVRKHEKGDLPIRLDTKRALWRDVPALLHGRDADGKAWRSSTTVRHLAELRQADLLPTDEHFELAAFGLCNDKARIDLWRFERFPLPLAYLGDDDMKADLDEALALSESVGKAVWSAGWAAASESLSSPDGRAPPRERIQAAFDAIAPDRLYWSRLEVPFRKLLEDLANPDEITRRSVRRDWFLQTLQSSAREAYATAAAKLDEHGSNYRAYAAGERVLNGRLGKLRVNLPKAPQTQKEEAAHG